MILVTGGTGLIGSHLLFELMKTETNVRAIYRDRSRISAVKTIFDYYSDGKPHHFDLIEWVKGDVLDIVSLEDAFVGVTHVYHCAALVSFNSKDFKQLIKVNREGTANLLQFCLYNNIQKYVHISSTAAIGGVENSLTTEETKWNPSNKTSGYAVSKYLSEKEVWRASEEGLDVVIINPCVIIGAGNWDESSLTIFRTVKKGIKFYTSGQNAFVDARDVSTCMVKLMKSDIKSERFLCISENVPFKKLFELIAKALNKKAPSISSPKWLMGFTWRLVGVISFIIRRKPVLTRESAISAYNVMNYSNEKIKKALDFEFISVEDAIENAVKFNNHSTQKDRK